MLKKIIIFFFISILLVAGLAVYLNKVYLPIKAKAIIIEAIEKSTGRKADLAAVKLNILKGITLEGLVIAGEDALAEPAFLKVKEASVGWLILPLLKQRQIIIPFINIYDLELNLHRYADNTFNVPGLKQDREKAPEGFSLVVYKANIKNARLNFIDDAVTPHYSQSILLNMALSFSLPKSIKYSLSANLENPDKSPIALELKGDFDLSKNRPNSLVAQLENLNLTGIAPYCKDMPFSLKKGTIQRLSASILFKEEMAKISLKTDVSALTVEKDKFSVSGNAKLNADGVYNIKTKALSDYSGILAVDRVDLSGLSYIKDAEDLSAEVSFSTDGLKIFSLKTKTLGALFNINGEVSNFNDPRLNIMVNSDNLFLEKFEALLSDNKIAKFPVKIEGPAKIGLGIGMQLSHPETLAIKGEVMLKGDKVRLTELKQDINAISGTLVFSKDKIETTNLKASGLGAEFNISGAISNFKAPHLIADIVSDSVPLGNIKKLLAENKIIDFPANAEGNIGLAVALNMPVLEPDKLQLKGEANLKDNKLSLTDLKEVISGLSGKVSFNNNAVEWKDITAEFKKIKYNSSGTISDFASPNIKFDLVSQVLNLKASGKLKDNAMAIRELAGKYLNSEFSASGSAVLSGAAPQVDIDADIKLSLEDLKKIFSEYFPEYLTMLDKVNFKGLCDINLSAGGKLNDPRAMALNAALESEGITAYIMGKQQLKFENVRLNMAQKNMRVSEFRLTSSAYGGKIDLIAEAGLSSPDPEFNLKFEAANVDLAKLKSDTELKDKDLSGLLSANLSLKGRGLNTNSFFGKGFVSVKEGNLWEFAPFKKLGQFLFIPSFEKIVFGEAEADLAIEDGNIFSDEAVLKSQQVNLFCYGKMDFNGNLDYIIKSEFNPEVARDSSNLMQILSSAIGKVNQFTTVKLTGTIEKPKLGIAPTAVETLKEIFN